MDYGYEIYIFIIDACVWYFFLGFYMMWNFMWVELKHNHDVLSGGGGGGGGGGRICQILWVGGGGGGVMICIKFCELQFF